MLICINCYSVISETGGRFVAVRRTARSILQQNLGNSLWRWLYQRRCHSRLLQSRIRVRLLQCEQSLRVYRQIKCISYYYQLCFKLGMTWHENVSNIRIVYALPQVKWIAPVNFDLYEVAYSWCNLRFVLWWHGGSAVRSSDLRTKGPRFNSQLVHYQVTTFGKLFTPTCLCRCKCLVVGVDS